MSDCFFTGKAEDDIERYIDDRVFKVLENRSLTTKEEETIKKAMRDVIEIRILNHEKDCSQNRRLFYFSIAGLIVSILALLSAIGIPILFN